MFKLYFRPTTIRDKKELENNNETDKLDSNTEIINFDQKIDSAPQLTENCDNPPKSDTKDPNIDIRQKPKTTESMGDRSNRSRGKSGCEKSQEKRKGDEQGETSYTNNVFIGQDQNNSIIRNNMVINTPPGNNFGIIIP